MCIPKPPTPTAQPTTIPSLQSATALQLGGEGASGRGASQLGRLALRFSGSPSTSSSAANASSAAAGSGASTPAPQGTDRPATPKADTGLGSLLKFGDLL